MSDDDTAERSLDAIAKLVTEQGHALDVETLAMIVRLSGRDIPELPERKPGLREELDEFLYPELYPLGNARHDPDHAYWQGSPDPDGYQWDSDTIEGVAQILAHAT